AEPFLTSSPLTQQMKQQQLDDLLARDRNSPNPWKSHARSQRARSRSACSCSNSALFPYG
ncbi:hypothetical protein KUCAC02_024295, partial [Chaenocephalus aceratus]